MASGDNLELWKNVCNPPIPIKDDINLLLIRPKQFAEQLSFYEHHKFKKLKFHEFIGQKWVSTNKNRNNDCPNIVEYSDHYNSVSNWCINHILDQPTAKERANVIDKFIHILLLAFQQNNFLATFEILFALNSVSIYRLSETWSNVSIQKRRIIWVFQKYISDRFKLYKIDFATVSKNSFKNYCCQCEFAKVQILLLT